MDLVEYFAEPGVSIVAACAAVGASRATLYRGTRPVPPRAPRQRAPSPRRLGDDERQAIVDTMHSPEFVDQPPMEVFAKLLSRGVYLASIRTFYHVLAGLGESKERCNQRLPHPYVKPSLTATAPNQPDYPGFFAGLLHARGWLSTFFGWHNDEHQHSGLAPIESMVVTVASDATVPNTNPPTELVASSVQKAPHAAAKTPRREALAPATAAFPS